MQRRLSTWTPRCHRLTALACHNVDSYFLEHWPFPDGESKLKFVKSDLNRVTCYYYPDAKDDRIEYACKLLTILFLIDDLLEYMSLAEGKALNDSLINVMTGAALPDPTIPAEGIMHEICTDMRKLDRKLAEPVLEETYIFMNAQCDKARMTIKGFAEYFAYRERDVGLGLMCGLTRFCTCLHLSDEDLRIVKPLESYVSRHVSSVNDILSWEKELKLSQSVSHEGAVLCTAVKIVMDNTGAEAEIAKGMLWIMVREWELAFDHFADAMQKLKDSSQLKVYIEGIKYIMSGNERWSTTTPRYSSSSEGKQVSG